MNNVPDSSSRKIELPPHCCPHDVEYYGGDNNCDHDYPPESKNEEDTYVSWRCSKCGMITSFGVYQ